MLGFRLYVGPRNVLLTDSRSDESEELSSLSEIRFLRFPMVDDGQACGSTSDRGPGHQKTRNWSRCAGDCTRKTFSDFKPKFWSNF